MNTKRHFKTTAYVLLTAMLLLGTFGCTKNNADTLSDTDDQLWFKSDLDGSMLNVNKNITMRTERGSYPAGVKTLNVIIANSTDETVDYGAPYLIEKEHDDGWYRADMEDIAWIMIAYILAPGETQTHEISFEILDDPLDPGEYRIIKTIGGQLYSAHFSIPAAG